MTLLKIYITVIIVITMMFISGTVSGQTDGDCLDCHLDEELTAVRETGEEISVFFDTTQYYGTVHSELELSCVDCHADIDEIPHKENLAPVDCSLCHEEIAEEYRASLHGYALERNNPNAPTCTNCHGRHDIYTADDIRSHTSPLNLPNTCGACHNGYGLKMDPEIRVARAVDIYLGSIHGQSVARGGAAAATCSDCHGTHNMKGAADITSSVNKRNIPQTCGQCHGDIYYQYDNSIHGKALLAGITDTPVCTDCHGEHSIKSSLDPSSSTFKIAHAEQICADCHEDPRIIQKYGLPGGVFKTYQDSYHGMANIKGSENAATCISCHGTHNILPASDVNSTIHPDNVVKTCGACHENATARFVQSYSHVALTETTNPVDRFVRRFYIVLIILLVGGMVVHNSIIMAKYLRDKYRSGENQPSIVRFGVAVIVQHILLTIAFIALVLTGFALRFPDAMWVQILTALGLSEPVRGILHRIAAVLLIMTSVYHVVYILVDRTGRCEFRALMLNRQDFRDIKVNMLYYLGKSRRKPRYDKYDYSEKIEYWALIWGTVLMVLTGFVLWFPAYFIQFLPTWAVKVSETVHYYEAWLATLSILVWHFFFVILHPAEYPMSLSWLTGKISEREAKNRHPEWYTSIKSTENYAEDNGPSGE